MTPTQTSDLTAPSSSIRRTSSAINLRFEASDDVFGIKNESTATLPVYRPSVPETSEPTNYQERMAQGYLALVPQVNFDNTMPRPDRGNEIRKENVQGFWPSEAVVFVAK